MIVQVRNQNVDDQSGPQLSQIIGRSSADPADRVGKLGVSAILIATGLSRRAR